MIELKTKSFIPFICVIFFLISLQPISNCYSQTLEIQQKVKFLALGDSYTIGQSVDATQRWPAQLIDSLRKRGLQCFDPQIIATTGWTTVQLITAISEANLKNNYNLVSLLIGVNNYYQGQTVDGYKPDFETLLKTAIALAQGNASNVFVVSIPDYGFTPFGQNSQPTITAGINIFNDANRSITSKYNVPYFFITDISRNGLNEPDLVASDGLHPSGKQYSQWIKLILAGSAFNQDPADTAGTVTAVKKEVSEFSVYPNPFERELIFKGFASAEQELTIKIFNEIGELMMQENVAIMNDQVQVALNNLTEGFYIYQLISSDGSHRIGKVLKR